MFEIFFGWRKASKCKRLIRRVQCRLKLLKNKRESIIRQLQQDVVQLIKNGHQDCALSRIEQLYKDQNIKAVYDLLDSFCEFIIINLSYIRRHRDCPNDIGEAVSSLLYASARCGDLPELIKLRVLFSKRYGQKFALAAVELSLGNLVNRQIIENLCVKSVQEELKLNLLKDIARDNGIRLNYAEGNNEFELQEHEQAQLSIVNSGHKWIEHDSAKDIKFTYDGIDLPKLQISYEKKPDDIAKGDTSIPAHKKAPESPRSCLVLIMDSIGALDIAEHSKSHPMQKSSVHKEKFEEMGSLHQAGVISSKSSRQSSSGRRSSSMASSTLVPLNLEKICGTGSDSQSRVSERSVVYLDDVEELESSVKDVQDKDRRLSMFKSNIPLVQKDQTALTISRSRIRKDDEEAFEPSDGRSSSKSSSKRRHSSWKEIKRRYAQVENLSMKDVECALYYGKLDYSSSDDDVLSLRSYNLRKHQRNMTSIESPGSFRKKISSPKSPYSCQWIIPEDSGITGLGKSVRSHKGHFNRRSCGDIYLKQDRALECSLDRPCYFVTGDVKDEWEITYPLQKSRTKVSNRLSSRSLQKDLDEEDLKICRYSSDEAFSTNVKPNPKGFSSTTDKSTSKEIEEAEVIDCQRSCASSHDSSSRVTSPWTHARPPYLRALTMPPERPKESPSHQMQRSASHLPDQQSHSNLLSPSYVHPKLPEYDDLEAKFKTLKKNQSFGGTH